MAGYRLTAEAFDDLTEIADFTIGRFGVPHAREYHRSLEDCFERLAIFPRMGQLASRLGEGVFAFPFRSDVIYFEIEQAGVLIPRVLHGRMDPRRCL